MSVRQLDHGGSTRLVEMGTEHNHIQGGTGLEDTGLEDTKQVKIIIKMPKRLRKNLHFDLISLIYLFLIQ